MEVLRWVGRRGAAVADRALNARQHVSEYTADPLIDHLQAYYYWHKQASPIGPPHPLVSARVRGVVRPYTNTLPSPGERRRVRRRVRRCDVAVSAALLPGRTGRRVALQLAAASKRRQDVLLGVPAIVAISPPFGATGAGLRL